MSHRILGSLAFGLLVFSSRAAFASPNYPVGVQSYLGGKVMEPPCTLCHSSDLGGPGTVTTPFGHAVLSHGGAGKNDVGALKSALAEMDSEQTDSDCDGTPDLDELRAGSDPNSGPCQGAPTAQTGCALGPAEPGRTAWAAFGLLTLALGLRCGRRRNR